MSLSDSLDRFRVRILDHYGLPPYRTPTPCLSFPLLTFRFLTQTAAIEGRPAWDRGGKAR